MSLQNSPTFPDSNFMTPPLPILPGQKLNLIKVRLHSPVSIYGNESYFVRIGVKEQVLRELEMHKNLARLNFPVAKLVSEGERGRDYFYAEESLGSTVFGKIFSSEFQEHGQISDEQFSAFLQIISQYAEAQFKIATSSVEREFKEMLPSFHQGIHLSCLYDELPESKGIIDEVIQKITTRLSAFPAVFSQGDFNPHNLFPKGVIDFDMGFQAPFGYDLLTAIFHTHAFPKIPLNGYRRGYVFTEEQEKKFMQMICSFSERGNFPDVLDFIPEFLLARFVWSAVRMHDVPDLQKWRYDKLHALFDAYLYGGDFVATYKM